MKNEHGYSGIVTQFYCGANARSPVLAPVLLCLLLAFALGLQCSGHAVAHCPDAAAATAAAASSSGLGAIWYSDTAASALTCRRATTA